MTGWIDQRKSDAPITPDIHPSIDDSFSIDLWFDSDDSVVSWSVFHC
jgi:hypothetical protein